MERGGWGWARLGKVRREREREKRDLKENVWSELLRGQGDAQFRSVASSSSVKKCLPRYQLGHSFWSWKRRIKTMLNGFSSPYSSVDGPCRREEQASNLVAVWWWWWWWSMYQQFRQWTNEVGNCTYCPKLPGELFSWEMMFSDS